MPYGRMFIGGEKMLKGCSNGQHAQMTIAPRSDSLQIITSCSNLSTNFSRNFYT